MPFPSVNFTFWLCVCLPPSLLLTLWEVNKGDRSEGISVSNFMRFTDKFRFMTTSMHWRMPSSVWDLTDMESLLFAVYAGYMVILSMCYWVITNIRHVNREMERTIHDANEEMAATGLLQLEDRTLPDVQLVTLAGDSINEKDTEASCVSDKEDEEELVCVDETDEDDFEESRDHDLDGCHRETQECDNSPLNQESFEKETHNLLNYCSKEGQANEEKDLESLSNLSNCETVHNGVNDDSDCSYVTETYENIEVYYYECRKTEWTDSDEPNCFNIHRSVSDENVESFPEVTENSSEQETQTDAENTKLCQHEQRESQKNGEVSDESSLEILTDTILSEAVNDMPNIEDDSKMVIYVKEYSAGTTKMKCDNLNDITLDIEGKIEKTDFSHRAENAENLKNLKLINMGDYDPNYYLPNGAIIYCNKLEEGIAEKCFHTERGTNEGLNSTHTSKQKGSIRVCAGKYQEYKQKYLKYTRGASEKDRKEYIVSPVSETKGVRASIEQNGNKTKLNLVNLQDVKKIPTVSDEKADNCKILQKDQVSCDYVHSTQSNHLISEKELRNSKENEKESDSLEENAASDDDKKETEILSAIQKKSNVIESEGTCAKDNKSSELKVYRHVSKIQADEETSENNSKPVARRSLFGKPGHDKSAPNFGSEKKSQGIGTVRGSNLKMRNKLSEGKKALTSGSASNDRRPHTSPMQHGLQRLNPLAKCPHKSGPSIATDNTSVTENSKIKKRSGYVTVYEKKNQEYIMPEDQSTGVGIVKQESNKKQTDKNDQDSMKQNEKKGQGKVREKLGTISSKMRDFKDKLKSKDLKIIKNELKKEESKTGECSGTKKLTEKGKGLQTITTPLPSSIKSQKSKNNCAENGIVQKLVNSPIEKVVNDVNNIQAKEDSRPATEENDSSDDDGDQWDEEGLNEWLRTTW